MKLLKQIKHFLRQSAVNVCEKISSYFESIDYDRMILQSKSAIQTLSNADWWGFPMMIFVFLITFAMICDAISKSSWESNFIKHQSINFNDSPLQISASFQQNINSFNYSESDYFSSSIEHSQSFQNSSIQHSLSSFESSSSSFEQSSSSISQSPSSIQHFPSRLQDSQVQDLQLIKSQNNISVSVIEIKPKNQTNNFSYIQSMLSQNISSNDFLIDYSLSQLSNNSFNTQQSFNVSSTKMKQFNDPLIQNIIANNEIKEKELNQSQDEFNIQTINQTNLYQSSIAPFNESILEQTIFKSIIFEQILQKILPAISIVYKLELFPIMSGHWSTSKTDMSKRSIISKLIGPKEQQYNWQRVMSMIKYGQLWESDGPQLVLSGCYQNGIKIKDPNSMFSLFLPTLITIVFPHDFQTEGFLYILAYRTRIQFKKLEIQNRDKPSESSVQVLAKLKVEISQLQRLEGKPIKKVFKCFEQKCKQFYSIIEIYYKSDMNIPLRIHNIKIESVYTINGSSIMNNPIIYPTK